MSKGKDERLLGLSMLIRIPEKNSVGVYSSNPGGPVSLFDAATQ
jgi:hypothetical protein